MLHLVDPHRNHIRLIQQDIRRHQHRVGKEPRIDIVRMLGRLILKLGHAVQLSHVGKAVQNPRQLRMAGYVGLIIDAVLLRVKPGRNIQGQKRPCALSKLRRILPHRNGMHIHHAVKTLILIA